ncbi:AfsR/SARP family transcriptional regulator [Longispora albida]|uniref:AfsR/SARP family transcriptional regulator n=1 Tax=Longispora albida TaxID=203523 RepID=UPI00035E1A3A|nr:BTAD domain-containing putative transcriptional regulator [Longispora albida]
MTVELRILGPVQLLVDGTAVTIGPPRRVAVLAALLAEHGRLVQQDTLTQRVWGDEAPDSVRSTLHAHLSRIRALLDGTGVQIRREGSGYLASVPDGVLDLQVFRSMVAEARALPAERLAERAALLAAALGQWRGRPLSGLTGPATGWAERTAETLDRQRLTVIAEWADAELQLDRPGSVLDALATLTAEYPLAEQLTGRLMLALARSGRRAEALDVYARAREHLAAELGENPGPYLRDLHTRMLRGEENTPGDEPAAAEPAPGPAPVCQLPAGVADHTGRLAETGSAIEALSRADGRAGALVTISGMGGTGKTSLAVHIAHQVRDQYPGGQLFAHLRGLDEHPAQPADVLAEFLRALGVAGHAIPDRLDDRAAAYRSLLSSRRVLVVLDDATDERQVRHLLPGAGHSAVLVTSRSPLSTLDGALRLRIGELPEPEALDLLRRASTPGQVDADPAAARHLAELCARMPLALRVAGARLAHRPHWTAAELVEALADERDRLDALDQGDLGVRTSLALSFHALPGPAAGLLLRLATLPSTDFPGWAAAALLDQRPAPARETLELLVDAQLVQLRGRDDLGQVRYQLHDLVRLFAREESERALPVVERAECRERYFDGWLALAEEAERRAPHGYLGPSPLRPDRWPWLAELRGRLIADPYRWLEAEMPVLTAVVEAAAEHGYVQHAWRIARSAVGFFEVRGRYADWRRTHEAALRAAREVGDRQGTAAMLHGLGELTAVLDDYDTAPRCLTEARDLFTTLGDPQGAVLSECALGVVDRILGRREESVARLRSAAAEAGAHKESRAEAYARYLIGMTLLDGGDYPAAEAEFARSQALAHSCRFIRGEQQALRGLAVVSLRTGNLASARGRASDALVMSQRIGDELETAYTINVLGDSARQLGELAQAEKLLTSSLAMFRRCGEKYGEAATLHLLGEVYLDGGQPEPARSHLEAARVLWDLLDAPAGQERTARALNRLS